MEYVFAVTLIVWIACIVAGVPVWEKYVNWVSKNFGGKR